MRHRIGKNKNGGRDFVIGDLHGAIERLYQFMAFVNFDKTKDRIFSVGDLVDRGPNSLECLMLIYEPWFFAVRGNHEQLMADFFFNGPTGMWWAPNGGAWGIQYAADEVDDHAAVVRDAVRIANELPLMLTVEKQDGGFFHVIHAELSSPVALSDKDLDDEETFRYVSQAPSPDGDTIIWGRYIFMPLYGLKYDKDRHSKYFEGRGTGMMFGPNLSHIYSGHTIMRHPTRYMGQTNLDTGAYRSIREVPSGPYGRGREPDEWAALTVTEPLTDKFWKVNELGVTEVEPIVI